MTDVGGHMEGENIRVQLSPLERRIKPIGKKKTVPSKSISV